MKIKSKEYCVFYKNSGKWIMYKADDAEPITKKHMINECGNVEKYLKVVRRQIKRPVKLMQQVWQEYYEKKN